MYFTEQGRYVFFSFYMSTLVMSSVFSLYIFNAPSSILHNSFFRIHFLLAPNLLVIPHSSVPSLHGETRSRNLRSTV